VWASGLDKPASEPYLDHMRSSVRYYFDLAEKIALSKDDKRSFKVGALCVRNDGVIVGAPNSPVAEPDRKAHAEYRTAKKIDFNGVFYIVRMLRRDNSLAIARPCPDCANVLRAKRVKKVYYSISPNEYGCWFPHNNTDTYFRF